MQPESSKHFQTAVQVEEPVYFVDFLREPEMDEETGEVVDAHPSFYEGVTQGLPEVRTRVEALQVRNSSVHGCKEVHCGAYLSRDARLGG